MSKLGRPRNRTRARTVHIVANIGLLLEPLKSPDLRRSFDSSAAMLLSRLVMFQRVYMCSLITVCTVGSVRDMSSPWQWYEWS